MERYCYFNGKFISETRAAISPRDIGVLRGYAVFDFLVTQNGKPFLFDDHFARLQRSAKELGLSLPVSKAACAAIMHTLITRHPSQDAVIRTVLTGGVSSNGFAPDGTPTFYILIEPRKKLPPAYYRDGARLITVDYQRFLPHVKTTHYIEAVRNNALCRKKNAVEILYVKDGLVLESASSNFFIVKRNKLITPAERVLPGITKKLVLKFARNKFIVEQRPLRLTEMYAADEAFLTASNKNILPIVKIDDRTIGTGRVGDVTKELMHLFDDFVKKY
ncbi:MAG: aminotransferase class IV [Patescibacteria group bacterium]